MFQSRQRWEVNVKINHKSVEWIYLAKNTVQVGQL